jgi:hypothetical protein
MECKSESGLDMTGLAAQRSHRICVACCWIGSVGLEHSYIVRHACNEQHIMNFAIDRQARNEKGHALSSPQVAGCPLVCACGAVNPDSLRFAQSQRFEYSRAATATEVADMIASFQYTDSPACLRPACAESYRPAFTVTFR